MKLKNLTVGILGVGEAGSALAKLVKPKYRLLVKDIDYDQIKNNRLDVLHICIPYSESFIATVAELIGKTKPKLTIIEATVPLKITQKLYQKTKAAIVHSPIRGVHPHLSQHLKTFVKFIGPTSRKAGRLAQAYYATLGIKKTRVLNSSLETELGKLLDTTYYALAIAWHQEMARFCSKYKINFDQAVTQFNQTYNQGYQKIKPNVVRPVLTPGFIGGHCLIPNIDLLKKGFRSDFLEAVIASNQKKARNK